MGEERIKAGSDRIERRERKVIELDRSDLPVTVRVSEREYTIKETPNGGVIMNRKEKNT